jgi:2-hydroxychromene-2-carboxylate isomerase
MPGSEAAAAFYFDLASPEAYIAAERILQTLTAPCEWRPILARELPHAETFDAYRCAEEQSIARSELERRAARRGLLPLLWPAPFPFDSRPAMLAATYAKQIGRTVAFAQAAFRQAFAGGHALSELDFVLVAAAACEMHPNAVLKAIATRSVADELDAATTAARELGVSDVPAVAVGARVFVGEAQLEAAAAALGQPSGTGSQLLQPAGNDAIATGP